MVRFHHEACSQDGKRYLYEFIRGHGGWDNWCVHLISSHYTYDEAKCLKILGTLNVYDDVSFCPTIYKIECRDPTVKEKYIGQTVCFDDRRESHFLASLYKPLKLYDFIREHGGWKNWRMVRVKEYPHCFVDGEELDKLEWYWWKLLGGELNSLIPGDTKRHGDAKMFQMMKEYEQMVSNGDPERKDFFGKTINL